MPFDHVPLNIIGALMPEMSRCLRQNEKLIAQRTQIPPKDEEQWRCNCAHLERDESEEEQRQRRH
jgi:hypothetical protein